MEIPDRIARLSAKPGIDWNTAEVSLVQAWLLDRAQLQTVWFYATRYLGKGTSQQDVEDAVVDFYTLIDQARKSFRPGGPNFVYYLIHICFRNSCVREGNKIRRRLNREMSIEFEQDDQFVLLQLPDLSAESDPGRRADSIAFTEDLSEFLNTAELPEKQKTVFVLRYLEGMSYESIADTVGSPVGSVKGWLSRATVSARNYLEERGWSE